MLFSARFWQELSRQKFFWEWFSKLKKKCFKELKRIFATGFVRKGPFLPHQHAWNHSGQRSLLQAYEKSLFCLEGKFSKFSILLLMSCSRHVSTKKWKRILNFHEVLDRWEQVSVFFVVLNLLAKAIWLVKEFVNILNSFFVKTSREQQNDLHIIFQIFFSEAHNSTIHY